MLEVLLVIVGGIIFVLSFLIPEAKKEANEVDAGLAKDEIKKLVQDEMAGIKGQVDDAVSEAIDYAMEKTERSLERLSNEKIMAVNEYSDTVISEIHKNHEEVMFLYDMLNDKHVTLKNTVSEANKAAKEASESAKEAENAAKELTMRPLAFNAPVIDTSETDIIEPAVMPVADDGGTQDNGARLSAEGLKIPEFVNDNVEPFVPERVFPEEDNSDFVNNNKNEEILSLHKQGKSKVAIAKQLGLGVGEVKLVIDLYENGV
ncbi:MAG: hypothetical protein IJ608_09090 [Lachnospiraceae bacterium]|nr:hypothetical protein [Lachnospiraceae bacterium]